MVVTSTDRVADLVVGGGPIATMAPPATDAGWMVVARGEIMAIGSRQDVEPWLRAGTPFLDLDGRLAIPGFQDAHVHPPIGGLDLLRCNLAGDPDLSAYLRTVGDYAGAQSGRRWVLGGGWAMDRFPGGIPTRDHLDRVVPERPVFLVNRDRHGAWVNTLALEMAGIDRHTPDPPDGRIERDAEGQPVGCLQEGAMALVERVIPATTPAEYREALRTAQRYLISLGITAWQDAWVTPEVEHAYRELASSAELKARVVAALWWERSRGAEQIKELVTRRADGPVSRFRPAAVKMMLDGVAENFTASMLEPFLDREGNSTENRGIDFIDPAELDGYVTELDARGFQVHFHAIGDRAVRNALSAVARARAVNGPTDNRHHIAHLQVVHRDDVARFRELEVVATAQPFWAVHEDQQDTLTLPFLGSERARRQYPWSSLTAGGARLAFGSDWPVSTPDPLAIIETAVRRVSPFSRTSPEFYPDERLDLETALRAATLGSAYVNQLDRSTGSLERGKLADFVILDRDIRSYPVDEIADARVEATFIEGECVYEAGSTGLSSSP